MKAIVSAVLTFGAMILAAQAGARDDAKVVPEGPLPAWRQHWGYSDAIVTGDTIYLAGIVAETKDGDPNLEAAYARAFESIGDVLRKAGASWNDVVEITSFHTDVKTQMEPMIAVKNRYIRAPFPAWTAIQVVRLIPDRGITEIRIIARLPARLQALQQ
jgi:Putative translation initiation inhibitor, yjgF family